MKGYVEANGITLHYLEYGTGPVLVLAHGLTANAHSFGALIEAGLADHFRVIVPDLRGRGLSTHPSSGYSLEDHAMDMLGLLDALGLHQVTFGGHSYGGYLAYLMAAEYPERIERCVAIDAPSRPDPGILDQLKPALDRLSVVLPSVEDYLATMQAMPWFQESWNEHIESFYVHDLQELPDGTVTPRSNSDHIMEAAMDTLVVDLPAIVAAIARPTLLIRAVQPLLAGYPLIFPDEVAREAMGSLADATMVDVAADHYQVVLGSGAGDTAQAIADFASGVQR
ncbi:MAG: alpha/beta hydrolase [Acidimicrobiia bacterium]|nr:alpha/beta hydrolase [Acidimicrobiia bacterium]NNF11507.1 alpha/beta hydrolase [Acidimicrobiia bacterium]NNL69449.1 alpha/beta hydrolase [Acidimicrobiia bacterium]